MSTRAKRLHADARARSSCRPSMVNLDGRTKCPSSNGIGGLKNVAIATRSSSGNRRMYALSASTLSMLHAGS